MISSVGDPLPFLPPQLVEFASSGRCDLEVHFLYDERAQADPLKRFFPSKFTLSRKDGALLFEGVNGRRRPLGRISLRRDRGEMGLPLLDRAWRLDEERELVAEALQAFVKACLQCCLLKSGGSMLHAAGVAFEGKGYAFVGHTGSGKTTLTRGLPESSILGDDLVAMREEGAGFVLYGTPWPGREGGKVALGGLPLRAICNLHPELSTGLRRMSAVDAVAELSVNAPRLGYEGEEEELLAIFSSVASTLPIYQLSMRLEDDLVSWLEKLQEEEEKGHRQGTGGQTA
jgi:hypothetical protein